MYLGGGVGCRHISSTVLTDAISVSRVVVPKCGVKFQVPGRSL